MKDPRKKDSDPSGLRSAGMLLAIPSLLIVAPLMGFFLGRWLDRRFATDPWFMIAGVILGFVAAGRETFLIIRRVEAEEERDKRR